MQEKAKEMMSVVYDENKQDLINNTRNQFSETANFILENIKDSREKSLVLTKLEEACMWAIKGITREK